MLDRKPTPKNKINYNIPATEPKEPAPVIDIPAREGKPDKLSKEKQTRFMMIGGGALALLAAAGLMAGVLIDRASATKNEDPLDPNGPNYAGGLAPTATVEAVLTAEPTPIATPEQALTYEQQVAALEIPAGLSAEELAKLLVEERWTQWANAGVSTEAEGDELYDEWSNYADINGLDAEGFAAIKAGKNAEVFVDALFVDDWRNKTDLVKYIEREKRTNSYVLLGYMATAWAGRAEDKEPYRNWFTVDSVKEVSTNKRERTLTIEVSQNTNDDKNSMEPLTGDGKVKFTVTLQKNEDGTEKISSARIWEEE